MDKLGLRRDIDLALHLPLRYEDETHVTPIAAALHGAPALVEGEILSSDVAYRPRRQLVLKVRDDPAGGDNRMADSELEVTPDSLKTRPIKKDEKKDEKKEEE